MFNFQYVYIVQDNSGKIVNVFKKRENAIESLPETHRNFPKELSTGSWEYGQSNKWKINKLKVEDSNDLSYVKPR